MMWPGQNGCSVGSVAIQIEGSARAAIVLLQCLSPLLAQSGHPDRAAECPLPGVKLTTLFQSVMSGFDPKRSLGGQICTRALHYCEKSG
jgi:hypothetical protein